VVGRNAGELRHFESKNLDFTYVAPASVRFVLEINEFPETSPLALPEASVLHQGDGDDAQEQGCRYLCVVKTP
jgi:hypothetical protein